MARGLLVAVVVAHSVLFALVGADEPGGESGSGEDECIVPKPLPDPLGGPLRIASLDQPRCHLACIEEVYKYK